MERVYLKTERYEEAKSSAIKSLELFPDSSEPYLLLAQISLIQNQKEVAWEYLEQLPVNDLTNWDYNYLHKEPEFEPIRKDSKWEVMIKKYFPKKDKK